MLLAVGRIGRPHGLRGEVAVELHTDDPGQRFAPGCVLTTQPGVPGQLALSPLTVAAARPHAGGLIVGFSEVTDRDEAERLRGVWLVVDSADVPASDDPDEFHDHQLVGLDVLTVDGSRVGTVADVRHHGQDLLVIHRDNGAATARPGTGTGTGTADELLVPFVAAIVPAVDLEAGRVLIDPPPGLLGDVEPA
jgi:16S rRNA processing protein RimM